MNNLLDVYYCYNIIIIIVIVYTIGILPRAEVAEAYFHTTDILY